MSARPLDERFVSGSGVLGSKRTLSEPSYQVGDIDSASHLASQTQRRRIEGLEQQTISTNIIERINSNPSGRLIALDIDQCSALGEDTNDIMQIISRMTNGLDPSSVNGSHLLQIVGYLINPRMIEAVHQIKTRSPDTYIVFYTSKAAIVNFFNPPSRSYRPSQLLKESGLFVQNDNDLMKFQPGDLLHKWDYLYKQLPRVEGMPWLDTSSAFCEQLRRVAILTWWASNMLGLPYAAGVYITRGSKDMRIICRDLGISDINKCVLFDDKAVNHAAKLGLSLGEAHMIPVTPHGTRNTPKEVLRALHTALTTNFPIKDEFAREFDKLMKMASKADPEHWPIHNCAITPLSEGPHQWHDLEKYGANVPGAAWDVAPILPERGSQRLLVSPGYASREFPEDFDRVRIGALSSEPWSSQPVRRNTRTLTEPGSSLRAGSASLR